MKKYLAIVCAICLGASLDAQVLWDKEQLSSVLSSDLPAHKKVVSKIVAQADKVLEEECVSVMMKKGPAVSGDMHDYYSLARYYWPNPNTPDGLPYVRRDGHHNPEHELYDRPLLGRMCGNVVALALAWHVTRDEKYAAQAAKQLRVWFVDKKTRMNPNLKYAQVSKGHDGDQGRPFGLIDSYSFVEMLDAVALLEDSKSFTAKDSKALKAWFGEFTKWYLTSEQGVAESNGKNNHAVAYDVQAAVMSAYSGDLETARRIVSEFPARRIFTQIEPDGKQPLELARASSFNYSVFNLSHMVDIMIIGKHLGVDISGAESEDGRNFFKAAEYLAQYLGKGVEEWPYSQIAVKEWAGQQQNLCKNLYRIAKYVDPSRSDYLDLIAPHMTLKTSDRFNLLWLRAE